MSPRPYAHGVMEFLKYNCAMDLSARASTSTNTWADCIGIEGHFGHAGREMDRSKRPTQDDPSRLAEVTIDPRRLRVPCPLALGR